jgi:PTS system glucose-specific IIA component
MEVPAMFKKLFARKEQTKELTVVSPVSGTTIPLEEVPDPVFSQKLAGDGVAIKPAEGVVKAPFDGKVAHLYDTGHAIVLEADSGLQLLIHVGLDTVKLKGEGFTRHVAAGDRVKTGNMLLTFDLQAIEQAGLSTVTPIVVANGQLVQQQSAALNQTVRAGSDTILEITLK